MRQAGDRHGGQRLHLDAGLAGDLDGRAARTKPGQRRVRLDVDRDLGERQRMAERDQLVRALGRHDAGDAGGAEHVALLGVAVEHDVERLRAASRRGLRRPPTRSVAALAETSTMRASPRLAEMGELGGLCHGYSRRRRGHALARQQRAGRGRDVGLAHQAFADQEGRDADRREPGEIGRREDAALADDRPVARARAAPAAR